MSAIEKKTPQVRIRAVTPSSPLARLFASVGFALLATLALALVGAAVAATAGL